MNLSIRSSSLALLLVCLCATAHADKNDREKAKAHYKLGETYFKSGEYAQAVEEYKKSYELAAAPLLLFNIGQAYRLGGDIKEAVSYYEKYLEADPKGSQVAAVKGYLKDLRAKDSDGDGTADLSDQCPGDAEDRDGFQDDDGCPDADNDGDGLLDTTDVCPMVPEDPDGFQDDDGCVEDDNDGDGFKDAVDACVNDAGTEKGCPKQEPGGGKVEKVEKVEKHDHLPELSVEKDTGGGARPGGGYRILFYGSAVITAAAAAGIIVAGLRVRSIEDDISVLVASHDWGGSTTFPDDACREAEADGYTELANACSDQSSMVLTTNVLIGVSAVALGASAFFFYKGFLSPGSRRKPAERVQITPTITPQGAGIDALVHF